MKRFGMMRRGVGVLLLPMVLATGAYGLTAGNTVPDNDAGDGTQAVTGYTVTSGTIDYNLNGTNPYNVDSVTFELDADDGSYEEPDITKIRLDSDSGVWYTCAADGLPDADSDTFTCDTTVGTQLTVANVDELRVVAVE